MTVNTPRLKMKLSPSLCRHVVLIDQMTMSGKTSSMKSVAMLKPELPRNKARPSIIFVAVMSGSQLEAMGKEAQRSATMDPMA